jgi:hypothetical protein
MIVDAASSGRVALQNLLEDFANRLNGAVDFWTIVCLGAFPSGRGAFLSKKSQELCEVLRKSPTG